MAYHLKHGESVPQSVRRIAREEIESAIGQLRGETANGDCGEAIHEARKSVKKLRALLRLVRKELRDTYRIESVRLRDAGRALAPLRDAGALIGTFDELRGSRSRHWGTHSLDRVRETLVANQARLEGQIPLRQLMLQVAGTLGATGRSIARWPLHADGFAAIEDGLRTAFRRGRDAFAEAASTHRREDCHEWRKRLKDHWYHIRLMEPLWNDAMRSYEQHLKQLETGLGDSLNLSLLARQIAASPEDYGTPAETAMVLEAIDESRKQLEHAAFEVGDTIYRAKPRRVTALIRDLWSAWKA